MPTANVFCIKAHGEKKGRFNKKETGYKGKATNFERNESQTEKKKEKRRRKVFSFISSLVEMGHSQPAGKKE